MLCQHWAALDFAFTVVYLINYNVLGPLSLSADIKGSSKGTNNYEFQAIIIIIIKFNSSQSRLCFISSSPRQTIPEDCCFYQLLCRETTRQTLCYRCGRVLSSHLGSFCSSPFPWRWSWWLPPGSPRSCGSRSWTGCVWTRRRPAGRTCCRLHTGRTCPSPFPTRDTHRSRDSVRQRRYKEFTSISTELVSAELDELELFSVK